MDSSLIHLWRRLQSLAKVFRFVEIFIVFIFLMWISTRLPFVAKLFGEYLYKTVSYMLCPTSIFLVGNVIVVTLLAKSGLFAGESSFTDVDIAVADLYRKLRSDDADDGTESESPASLTRLSGETEEVVFQDKEVIVCEGKVSLAVHKFSDEKIGEFFLAKKAEDLSYRRSKSEKFNSNDSKKEKLRRSETDICRKYGGEESTVKLMAEEEGECGEEFRRTIEAFIAKQVRFHREESLAVVIHGQT